MQPALEPASSGRYAAPTHESQQWSAANTEQKAQTLRCVGPRHAFFSDKRACIAPLQIRRPLSSQTRLLKENGKSGLVRGAIEGMALDVAPEHGSMSPFQCEVPRGGWDRSLGRGRQGEMHLADCRSTRYNTVYSPFTIAQCAKLVAPGVPGNRPCRTAKAGAESRDQLTHC